MADTNTVSPNDLIEQGVEPADRLTTPPSVDADSEAQFQALLEAGHAITDIVTPVQADPVATQNRAPIDDRDKVVRLDQAAPPPADTLLAASELTTNVNATAEAGTLGDKILQGMQNIRAHVEDGARQVAGHLQPASETMSMREMFHTQWALANLMLTEDYIGKVVSKSTQAFDTLLRNQ